MPTSTINESHPMSRLAKHFKLHAKKEHRKLYFGDTTTEGATYSTTAVVEHKMKERWKTNRGVDQSSKSTDKSVFPPTLTILRKSNTELFCPDDHHSNIEVNPGYFLHSQSSNDQFSNHNHR